MVTKVILISGAQGSGKSTLSADLRRIFLQESVEGDFKWNAVELIFAEAIYDMHNFCRDYMAKFGISDGRVKDGDLLQFLGTDWGRKKFGPDVWVKILQGKILEHKIAAECLGVSKLLVCVPDTRFKNELDAWPGAFKVRLECPKEVRRERCSMWRENTEHPSEVDLDDSLHLFDLVLDSEKVPSPDLARKILFEMALAGPR